ncbi:MAG TPA: protein kinase [Thermoanaerobaculia bacterium]|nr:protein kinase [Thermoanaerobaculia bacterium]
MDPDRPPVKTPDVSPSAPAGVPEPAGAPAPFAGRTLGHFRLLERLGAGGMGDVYLAEDAKLGRRVAVKVLHAQGPSSDAERERIERFVREARAVAALNHPNIVTLHSVEEVEGVHFLVMEWVDGRTLAQEIPRGGLGLERIFDIAIPLADALAAAHERGIIHRDLKPQNVMVAAGGRVKVLDFGIAKLRLPASENADLPADPGLTGEGKVLGTAPYMSPEQLLGDAVDARSDLFSLGVVLYEMAAGRRPFPGSAPAEVIASILRDEPRPVSDLNPALPRHLGRIVARCLQKDPRRRFQTALDLRNELEDLRAELAAGRTPATRPDLDLPTLTYDTPPPLPVPPMPSIATPTGALVATGGGTLATAGATSPGTSVLPAGVHPRRIPRAVLWSAAALLVLVLAAVLAAFWLRDRRSLDFQPRDPIVLGFQNLTQEALLDDSLALAFRVALEQSRHVSVLPASRVRQTLGRMEKEPDAEVNRDLGAEICQREGIRTLVMGSVAQVGSAYTLSAEVVDPATDRTVFLETAEADGRDRLLDALERLANGVRAHLGESQAAIDRTAPLEKVTTRNLQALKAYSLGIERIAQGREEEAISLLERSLTLDPEFAMAHAKLGTVYNNFERDRAQAAEHWEAALRLGDRLTGFERLYLEGSRAWQGRPAEMLRIWSTLASLYPEQIVGHHNLGCVQWWHRNDFPAAAAAFGAATRVRDVLQFASYHHLGYAQLGLGRAEESRQSFETAWELSQNPINSGLADAYVVLGRHADAEAFLAKSLETPSPLFRLDARQRRLGALADQGRLREAAEVAAEAAVFAGREHLERGEHRVRMAAVALAEAQGGGEPLRRALAASLAAELPLLVAGGGEEGGRGHVLAPVPRLALLGKVSARSGDLATARDLARRLHPHFEGPDGSGFPLWQAQLHLLEGEILLGEGKPREAAARFQAAVADGGLFQAHESLARAHEAAGDLEAAERELRWLIDHRGQAFAEWLDQFYGKELNILDGALAPFQLARLAEARGRSEEAAAGYARFLETWKNADADLPAVREAKAGLARLKTSGSQR